MLYRAYAQLILHRRDANQDEFPPLPESPEPVLNNGRRARCVDDAVDAGGIYVADRLAHIEPHRRGIKGMCSAELFRKLYPAGDAVDADDRFAFADLCSLRQSVTGCLLKDQGCKYHQSSQAHTPQP